MQKGIAKNDNSNNVPADSATTQSYIASASEARRVDKADITAGNSKPSDNEKPADSTAKKDDTGLTMHDSATAKKDQLAKDKKDDKKSKQSNSRKTKNSKSAPAPSLVYGLQLSPLQLNVGEGNKLNIHYVPGLFGQYYFNGRLGIGLTLSPYDKQSTGSDSLYSSGNTAVSNDSVFPVITTTKKAYYANGFTSYKGAVSLAYKFSDRFTLEAGAGLQHITSGKVNQTITVYRDSILQSATAHTVRLSSADTAFQNIRKNTGFLFLNAWYNIKQWQFGIGYNQPLGSWLKTGGSKATPQVFINLRYNLRFSKKRR